MAILMRFKRVGEHDLPLPQHATSGSGGFDLRAAEPVLLEPGERELVNTGFAVAIPTGHVGLICPRSGLAAGHGVTVLNAPGVVDADYRGAVKVLLANLGDELCEVRQGDRIAQMVITRYVGVHAYEVDELDGTERGEGGFGHTGRD